MPCACDPEPGRTFSLLPCPGEELTVEEQRFTRLLREVKAGVVKRSFVQDGEARPLLARVRGLAELVERDRLAEADTVLEQALDRVLEFPRPARSGPRWPFVAVALLLLVLAGLGWFLIQ